MKKVLMVSCLFPPQGGPAVQRSYFFSRFLPNHGWEPTVVTTRLKEDEKPDASLDISQIKIEAVNTWEWPKLWGFLTRIKLHYFYRHFIFYDRIGFVVPGFFKIKKMLKEEKWDAFYLSISPNIFLLLLILLKKHIHCPVILDFRDPSYDYEANVWNNFINRKVSYYLTKSACAKADVVICNTPAIEEKFHKRFPEFDKKTQVIRNGFSEEDQDLARDRDEGLFKMFHAGTLTRSIPGSSLLSRLGHVVGELGRIEHEKIDHKGRSLLPITGALKILKEKEDGRLDRLHFDTAGLVNPRDWESLQDVLGDGKSKYHGIIPHAEVRERMGESQILFLPHWDHDCSRTVASKMYEYLAAHLPILACVPEGQMKEDLSKYPFVVIAAPLDEIAIAEAIRNITENYDELLKLAQASDVSAFSRENQTKKLAEILENL